MMPTKTELADQIARLNSTLDALRIANLTKDQKLAEQAGTIATLKQKRTALVPLKLAAGTVGISYKLALRWAERGGVISSAEKQRGRWFCNIADLCAVAATRNQVITRSFAS
jgi:hypothetical protein